jgi:hypothetical protein
MSYGEKHKAGLNQTMINKRYIDRMGNCANRELYVQFLIRIYFELSECWIANFSKLKNLQAPNFYDFREIFQAKIEKFFIVPANTFDNVKGKFPIGFFIWNTTKQEKFKHTIADIFNKEGEFDGQKIIHCYDEDKLINEWIMSTRNRRNEQKIGFLSCLGNDFQTQKIVFIMNDKKQMASPRGSWITDKNLKEVSIYYAVRHCVEANWLNDRDQFLYPNDGWKTDEEFQNDCLTYTLFNNNIQSKYGTNHWIPFTEYAVNSRDTFKSHFMTDFMEEKAAFDMIVSEPDLFNEAGDEGGSEAGEITYNKRTALIFSDTAKKVFYAGRNLWKYYHVQSFSSRGGRTEKQEGYNVNASLYDIREHFQGRNEKGIMNKKSADETYNKLNTELRVALKILAKKIEPKIYEYGFLKK